MVGLARSGQAAARGEAVRAVDSGHPEGAAGLEGVGVEVFLDTDGLAQLEGTRTVVKSPGVPREAAVIATALERGIEVVGEGLCSFAGVPHRLEGVAEIDGVRFVNDSEATNVASATVGIRAFDGGVHAILGGSEKEEPFTPLIDPIRERVRAAFDNFEQRGERFREIVGELER